MQIGKHRLFAAEEVIAAGAVDEEPVGRIGPGNRAVAPHGPGGEPLQTCDIAGWIVFCDHKVGDERLRMRDRHSGLKAKTPGHVVGRHQHATRSLPGRRDKRLVSRQVSASADTVRCPGREV